MGKRKLLLILHIGFLIGLETILFGEQADVKVERSKELDSLVSSVSLTNLELGDRFLDLYRRWGKTSRNNFDIAVEYYHKELQINPDNVYCANRLGYAYHLERRLKEASEHYARVLRLDPPQTVTPEEYELVVRFAPRLYINSREFFKLEDVVVILHPEEPLIEYSLFWDDDIDYPGDNDPTDHEKIWIQYDPRSGDVMNVYFYFHRAILSTEAALKDARDHHNRASINIQWGGHGSLPLGWQNIPADQIVIKYASIDEPDTILSMRSRFQAHVKSTRNPDHPLAKGWPKRFEGTWEEYIAFDRYINLADFIGEKKMVIKSRWSNAVIDQYFLDYQFFPKREWPIGAP
ncbi:MAG: tetratricopeptide repeat protein [Candidatus Marinimicrobia bacterium]|nr:tetratricopeptide repeat protein [Candidatus Neomarinimicrobiota bacterium]